MSKIAVSGLLNVETSVKVDSFPVEYSPIEYPFFGVSSNISGVGYNIAKALLALEDEIDLYSVIGDDANADLIKLRLGKDGIPLDHIQSIVDGQTAESVVLYDKDGRRKIYCDLKNLQLLSPFASMDVITGPRAYEAAILTNINFSRPLLKRFKESGVLVATDVHVLSNVDDDYNREFMQNADILFLSNEACMGREGDFIKEIYQTYHNNIIVIGCGEEGALAYIGKEDRYVYEKAVAPYGVRNTVGAGDALFSAFMHRYLNTQNVEKSLRFAVIFAGIKISSSGGAEGFPSEPAVLKLE